MTEKLTLKRVIALIDSNTGKIFKFICWVDSEGAHMQPFNGGSAELARELGPDYGTNYSVMATIDVDIMLRLSRALLEAQGVNIDSMKPCGTCPECVAARKKQTN